MNNRKKPHSLMRLFFKWKNMRIFRCLFIKSKNGYIIELTKTVF
ncbi:hypothetical protein ELI_2732 [Eubacterium callanderi]|uniref:Uncharacterized protein n=1 Tax=Eubacterium callanderi TaxID=53442 RepID=E3GEA3_9FIRM|nr:hypothetical protein ELI_2732 [Eubacterium callanderi]